MLFEFYYSEYLIFAAGINRGGFPGEVLKAAEGAGSQQAFNR